MAVRNPDEQQPSELLSAAQLEKVKLEIDELRSKQRWRNKITQFIPLISTLVAVAGFIFTVNQFIGQQKRESAIREREQAIRDETQIRTDISQLLNLTTDKEQATAS